jgi:hypothetical protein
MRYRCGFCSRSLFLMIKGLNSLVRDFRAQLESYLY